MKEQQLRDVPVMMTTARAETRWRRGGGYLKNSR